MNQAFDPLNIIILAVAVIIFLRLRSVLGSRTGNEKRFDPFNPADKETTSEPVKRDNDNVVPMPGRETVDLDDEEERDPVWKGFAEEGSNLAKGLDKIADADPDFAPKEFLNGAKIAYEMIVTAFAEGDRKQLKSLLTTDVYDGFESAISAREKAGHRVESQFVGIDKAELTDAGKQGRTAFVTVGFDSQIISTTYDSAGQIVDGDPKQVGQVNDLWTFERNTASSDPNWKLSATGDAA